jgi:hypothetical protein
MKKLQALLVGAVVAASLAACAYGGVAASGDKVVVARNDLFLAGLLRKAYVCQITDSGLANCATNEAP